MTRQEAIEIARRTAEEEGWAWDEPVDATLRRPWFKKGGRWEVYSNVLKMGAKARIVIDDETGKVLDKGYIPR
jgi:hypothetical protein